MAPMNDQSKRTDYFGYAQVRNSVKPKDENKSCYHSCQAVGHAQVKKEQWFLRYFSVTHKAHFGCIYSSPTGYFYVGLCNETLAEL